MKIATIQLPSLTDNLEQETDRILSLAHNARADALLLNEMPFGPWVAETDQYQESKADDLVAIEAEGYDLLARNHRDCLILGSQAVKTDTLLANRGLSLAGGQLQHHHQKVYLPQEDGWYEKSWFTPGTVPANIFEHNDIRYGYLICTELMYTETARDYLRQNVDVILNPRATGGPHDHWLTAAKMVAIWAGCYVVGANRAASTAEPGFNGGAYIVAPDARIIAVSDADNPVIAATIDLDLVAENRRRYPCILEA